MEYLCNDCPRRCGAARTRTQAGGVCLSPALPRVVRAAPHFGEEPCISGTRGSGTVFFSGCSLRCVFCQNREISRKSVGQTLSVPELRGVLLRLRRRRGLRLRSLSLRRRLRYRRSRRSVALDRMDHPLGGLRRAGRLGGFGGRSGQRRWRGRGRLLGRRYPLVALAQQQGSLQDLGFRDHAPADQSRSRQALL